MTYTDLFAQLVRAEIQLWNSLDHHLQANVDVTLATFQALSAVARAAGSVRVQDISDELSITVGASSKLVDRLERDGLVRRESNPEDRRSSIVVLTETGRVARSAAASATEDHLRDLLAPHYSPTRASDLASELASLRDRVREEAKA